MGKDAIMAAVERGEYGYVPPHLIRAGVGRVTDLCPACRRPPYDCECESPCECGGVVKGWRGCEDCADGGDE